MRKKLISTLLALVLLSSTPFVITDNTSDDKAVDGTVQVNSVTDPGQGGIG